MSGRHFLKCAQSRIAARSTTPSPPEVHERVVGAQVLERDDKLRSPGVKSAVAARATLILSAFGA
jgi:hypothetical protein